MPKALNIEKELLINLYFGKGLTIAEISKRLNTTDVTVRKYMRKYNIESRDTNHNRSLIKKLNITNEQFKKELYDLYIENNVSRNKIAQKYNVSPVVISRYLSKYNIPQRNQKESIKASSSGLNNHKWKGGKKRTSQGYIMVKDETHPNATQNYIYEHRKVMEEHLGRLLRNDEHVHHINERKDDNRIENLEVMSIEEHNKLHHKINKRVRAKSGVRYIHRSERDKCWSIRIKNKNYGSFKDLEDAKRKLKELL